MRLGLTEVVPGYLVHEKAGKALPRRTLSSEGRQGLKDHTVPEPPPVSGGPEGRSPRSPVGTWKGSHPWPPGGEEVLPPCRCLSTSSSHPAPSAHRQLAVTGCLTRCSSFCAHWSWGAFCFCRQHPNLFSGVIHSSVQVAAPSCLFECLTSPYIEVSPPQHGPFIAGADFLSKMAAFPVLQAREPA